MSSRSGFVVVMPSSRWKWSSVSDKFSKGSSSMAERKEESRVYAFLSLVMSCPGKTLQDLLSWRSTRTRRKSSPR